MKIAEHKSRRILNQTKRRLDGVCVVPPRVKRNSKQRQFEILRLANDVRYPEFLMRDLAFRRIKCRHQNELMILRGITLQRQQGQKAVLSATPKQGVDRL